MSVKKPIQCKIPPEWKRDDRDLMKLFSNRHPVYSFKCQPGQVPLDHSFRGEIVDGQYRGSGKLKVGQGQIPETDCCLNFKKILKENIVEVVGTFKDGLLHGVAKISLENGAVVIANFANGLFDGLRREWNPDGGLTFVGYYHQGAKAGKCFTRYGNQHIFKHRFLNNYKNG